MENTKYPRRKYRKISDQIFKISEPNAAASYTMKKIPTSNTGIEKLLEVQLIKFDLYFTKSQNLIEEVEGNPDFVLPKFKIAIFCDGDFWHGKNFSQMRINSNTDFWNAKIQRNIARDQEVNDILTNKGWKVFRFWEHEIKTDASKCVERIVTYIKNYSSLVDAKFTFVDLYAGIGGFRIPIEELGGKCLGFSEIDRNSIQVYKMNFSNPFDKELELGDITKFNKLPFTEIDLIVGGVPCQSWSVAGKMRAFDDPRGKLWQNTIEIVKINKPKAFIFENVKGLIDPRNKANLDVIVEGFEKAGYTIKKPQLLNSYDFGLPQNRDRVFIVGIRNDLSNYLKQFRFPSPINKKIHLHNIITGSKKEEIIKKQFTPIELFGSKIPRARNRFQKTTEFNDFFIFCDTRNGHTTIHSWDMIKTTNREKEICMVILKNRRKKIYGNRDGNPLTLKQLQALIPGLKSKELQNLVAKNILHKKVGNGYEFVNSKNSSGINGIYRIYLPHSNIFSTLTATGTRDFVALHSIEAETVTEYRQIFIDSIVKKKKFRPINSKEAGKLQGFPKNFAIHPNENLAKKQFGNAVSTSVIFHLVSNLINTNIFNNDQGRETRNN